MSNAFKFTPEEGKIEVAVFKPTHVSPVWPPACRPPKEGTIKNIQANADSNKLKADSYMLTAKFVEISISDNGIGIPKDRIGKIFDRFYQIDGSHTREHEGTGIGLSLTKELVELHKGEISVESEEGMGTKVVIRLPLGKDHLKPEEILVEGVEEQSNIIPLLDESEFISEVKSQDKIDIDTITKNEKPLLLIVEDNFDVRNYIKGHVEKEYEVVEAVNGKDGLDKALKYIPDIIISDVMMPKIDGFELCEKLKTNEKTSHVPVILLTAKAASLDKIEGLETGADDYIIKPFEANELKARIKNLIEQRKRLREYFKKEGIFELENKKITSTDKKFLQKSTEIINRHLSDTLFNSDIFAKEIAMSRRNLDRKFVGLIGETASDLIRRVRLNQAAKLIERKFGNISEIALEVGFASPAYFSKCFREQYGVKPSEYQNDHSK